MTEVRNGIMVQNRTVKNPQAAVFLEIFGLSQEMHTLPKPGGLLDQDSLFVFLLKHALSWQADRAELDQRKANKKVPHQR